MSITASNLATASLVGQVGGGISSAVGGYYSASAQKASMKAQAAIADTNARIAELGAQSALQQGQQQVAALTMQAGQLKSRQRAAMAANGIDLGVGNAAEVQASTDIMKEIDSATLEANAVRNAWGYRTQAVNYQNEALMSRASAKGINPGMTLATSLIGSATSVAGSWYGMKNAGMFGSSAGSTQWGTTPGSQQSKMLAQQESGFGRMGW
jgi:hypothetical protein